MDTPSFTKTYDIVDSPGEQTAKQAILYNESNLDDLITDYNAHDHPDIDTDDIAAASKTGSVTKVVTGTEGTADNLAKWNADGDLVDGPALSGADATVISGTAGTDGNTAIWNADGDIVDGPTPPTGTIVGTSDTQTLTNKTLTSPVLNTGVSGTAVKDEDNMASDSATHLATQQSIKAYVDTVVAALLPAGFIVPFAAESVPTGYLECNGAAVSRATYATLFSAIGDVFGVGDGSTTFNLPDLRGQFLRGWDHGAGTDPDAATRTDAGDGSTTGDHVGTKQADQIKAHTHDGVLDTTGAFIFQNSAGGDIDKNGTSGSTGGNETRPTNINVMYCIKY